MTSYDWTITTQEDNIHCHIIQQAICWLPFTSKFLMSEIDEEIFVNINDYDDDY